MAMKKILIFVLLCTLFFCSCAKAEETAALPKETLISKPTEIAEPTPEPTKSIYGSIKENGDLEVDAVYLSLIPLKKIETEADKPCILIYHTHASEAYLMNENYQYEESEEYRTLDNEKNVVHVGELLKTELEKLGFEVLHDTSNVEAPERVSAYSRSLLVMQQYEEIDLYAPNLVDYVTIDGKNCARAFCVVGTGEGTYPGEYDVKPVWESNYALAKIFTNTMQMIHPQFAKEIRMKPGRHNQHMGNCLLIELGHNANAMEHAENSTPYLAQAIAAVFA